LKDMERHGFGWNWWSRDWFYNILGLFKIFS